MLREPTALPTPLHTANQLNTVPGRARNSHASAAVPALQQLLQQQHLVAPEGSCLLVVLIASALVAADINTDRHQG